MKPRHLSALVLVLILAVGLFAAPRLQARADGSPTVTTLTVANSLALPECAGVSLLSPASPTFILSGDGVTYSWSGEPADTTARVLVFFGVQQNGGQTLTGLVPDFGWTGSAAFFPAAAGYEPGTGVANVRLEAFAGGGTVNWIVVFVDGTGAATCRSAAGWLDVRGGSSWTAPAPVQSAAPSGGTTPTVPVVPVCTYYTIVLAGSSYTGARDLNEPTNNYDGSAFVLGAHCGLIIHGNDNANTIYGSSGDDTIYGYAGNDRVHGLEGDDTIDAGAGDDIAYGSTGSDTIEGGAGADTVFGGWYNPTGQDRDDVGSDTITDSGGNSDNLAGGNYNHGGDGDDGDDTIIDAGGSNDLLTGGNHNHAGGSTGNDGNDTLTDSVGTNDRLFGGNFNWLGTGNDNVGGGGDVLNANDGAADWIIDGGHYTVGGAGTDGTTDTCNVDPGDPAATNCP